VSDGLRDGQHDFDFAFGSWAVTLSRLLKPPNWISTQTRAAG
jgi:hypothetical protein